MIELSWPKDNIWCRYFKVLENLRGKYFFRRVTGLSLTLKWVMSIFYLLVTQQIHSYFNLGSSVHQFHADLFLSSFSSPVCQTLTSCHNPLCVIRIFSLCCQVYGGVPAINIKPSMSVSEDFNRWCSDCPKCKCRRGQRSTQPMFGFGH